jgi:hypothetical protein
VWLIHEKSQELPGQTGSKPKTFEQAIRELTLALAVEKTSYSCGSGECRPSDP